MQLTRRAFTAGVAASAGILVGANGMAQSTPEATPISNDLKNQLQAVLTEYGVPGAAIAIQTSDDLEPTIYELGVANVDSGEPISADMHFRIASVTKPFVATVILQLVEEDLLSLETTIADILPDMQIANADTVMIRHLLNQRSGLPQVTAAPEAVAAVLQDPTVEVSFDTIADIVGEMPSLFPPDEMWDYNNLNYQILGQMIEAVTGETWDLNVKSRILQPLGLDTTQMTNSPEMPTPFANGYGYSGQNPLVLPDATPGASATPAVDSSPTANMEPIDVTLFNPTIAGASGGMISTIMDQLVWVQNLATGSLLSPEMHAAQIEGQPIREGSPTTYGFGVVGQAGMVGHYGGINGYQAAVMAAPDGTFSAAVLTNAMPTLGDAEAATEIMGIILNPKTY